MQDNPYSAIIGIMREEGSVHNPPSIMLAEVLSPPPGLLIKVGDIQVGNPNLLLADYLLPEYRRVVRLATTQAKGASDEVLIGDHGTHKHQLVTLGFDEGTIETLDTLKPRDLLAVMPTYDGQTYIILARVVRI